MNACALHFDGVTRRFGETLALDGLQLRVERGSVLGLVGRNGAGKTTALRLAVGVLHADRGSLRVLGLDPVVSGIEVRARVSLLSEEAALYPWMTVAEILDFGAALHERWDRGLADSLVRRLELDRRALVRTLSRGTRAKVALVLAAAARPELLLLDDPTAGLDPLVRREVLQGVLEAVPAEGGAVVYASHLIHDVERVADRVAFLDGGRLRLEDDLETLKQEVRCARGVFEDGAPAHVGVDGCLDWQVDGRAGRVVARAPAESIVSRLGALGASHVQVEPLSLEEILVACLRRPPEGENDRD